MNKVRDAINVIKQMQGPGVQAFMKSDLFVELASILDGLEKYPLEWDAGVGALSDLVVQAYVAGWDKAYTLGWGDAIDEAREVLDDLAP